MTGSGQPAAMGVVGAGHGADALRARRAPDLRAGARGAAGRPARRARGATSRRALLLAASLLAACSSVEAVGSAHVAGPQARSYDPDSTWYIYSDVWGFTFFAKLPVVAGDIERVGKLAWFRTTVNLPGCVRLLEGAAAAFGADELHELTADVYSEWCMLCFWLPEARASAIITRPSALRKIAPLEPPARR